MMHLPRIVSRFRWTAAVPRSPSISSPPRRWMASTNNNKPEASSTVTEPNTTTEPEAPKKGFLYRMAPPKGGTEPPDAKFLAVAAVVCSAGFYAWVIDPPKEYEE